MKKMKGYVYTLEVLLAVSLMFFSMVFVFRVPEFTQDTSSAILKAKGQDILKKLDENGDLRKIVLEDDIESLKINITSYMPQNIGFDAKICKKTCEEPTLPIDKEIVYLNYYISGDNQNYDISRVDMWIWVLI